MVLPLQEVKVIGILILTELVVVVATGGIVVNVVGLKMVVDTGASATGGNATGT
jgi:hypothetical protein